LQIPFETICVLQHVGFGIIGKTEGSPGPYMTSTAKTQNPAARPNRTIIVLTVAYGLLGPIAAFAKMGTVPLLLIGLLGYRTKTDLIDGIRSSLTTPFAKSCLALFTWSCLSFIWAEEVHALTLIRLAGVVIAVLLFVSLVDKRSQSESNTLTSVILAATLFMISVLLFEGLTGAQLHRLLRPEDTAPRVGEWVPYLEMVAARGTAILAPLCFLSALIIRTKSKVSWTGPVVILVSLAATWVLPMTASSLAILVGCVFYGAALWSQKWTARVLFTGLIAGALLTPVFLAFVVQPENFQAIGMEPSREMHQRMAIWDYSSGYVAAKPFLGYGFDAARKIGSQGDTIADTNWAALPLHPHNAFLQIWLELGLVGICLTCLILRQFWRTIEIQVAAGKRLVEGLASIGATATLSLISFGVWQYWWIAAWGLLIGVYFLCQRLNLTQSLTR
jgi:exopolysaccharide production protein ExoQ